MLQSLLIILSNLVNLFLRNRQEEEQKEPTKAPKSEPILNKTEPKIEEESSIMKLSTEGKRFIMSHEGLVLKPYLDAVGVPTIGYGNTYYKDGTKVTINDPEITKEEAELLFDAIVSKFEDGVNRLVKVPLNQNQFDALVSFAYNVGLDENKNGKAEGLGDSTLLRLLNAGDYLGAAKEFPKWNKAGGKELLTRRRKEEQELFLKPV